MKYIFFMALNLHFYLFFFLLFLFLDLGELLPFIEAFIYLKNRNQS